MTIPTKINIISRAFVVLSNTPINALDPKNLNHAAAQDLYNLILPELLQESWWQFARKFSKLSLLSEPPDDPDYTYAFQLPPDELILFKLFPQVDYRIYGKVLYTDEGELSLSYITQVEPHLFPPNFTTAFIYKLAAALAPIVTQNFAIAQSMEVKADKKLIKAMGIEGSQEPNEKLQNDPILEAHLNG